MSAFQKHDTRIHICVAERGFMFSKKTARDARNRRLSGGAGVAAVDFSKVPFPIPWLYSNTLWAGSKSVLGRPSGRPNFKNKEAARRDAGDFYINCFPSLVIRTPDGHHIWQGFNELNPKFCPLVVGCHCLAADQCCEVGDHAWLHPRDPCVHLCLTLGLNLLNFCFPRPNMLKGIVIENALHVTCNCSCNFRQR